MARPLHAAHSRLSEGRVELDVARREIEVLDEPGCLGGSVLTVHATVFPFDRQGALVAGLVESPDDLLKIDAAAARRAEVPAPPWVAEVEVAGEDARPPVQGHDRVLDVHMVDPVGERADELDRAHSLPVEMAGVEVEAELLAAAESPKGPLSGEDVEGDLGGMYLEGEPHAGFREHIEDRMPPLGELGIARLDHRLRNRRE